MAVEKKPKAKKDARVDRDMKAARRRAGVNVAVSVVVAVALLILINVISAERNFRTDVETLGRYGLSPTAERVLDEIGEKIILTSIYTSADEKKKPEDYLPRVRDLLDEIAEYGRDVTVVNASTDRQKAEVLGRLRQRLDEKAKDHSQAIKAFQNLAKKQIPQYQKMGARWQAYPAKGWLGRFGLAKAVENAFNDNKEDLRTTAADFRAQLAGTALPNYPEMVEKAAEALKNVNGRLQGIGTSLRQIATVPEKAEKAKAALTKKSAAAVTAADEVAAQAGKPDAPAPADPSATLSKIAAASTDLASAGADAQAALKEFNRDCGGYLRFARAWAVNGVYLPTRCGDLGRAAKRLAEQALGVRETVKVDAQKNYIVRQIRPFMPQLQAEVKRIQAGVASLLSELTQVDEGTKTIFESAKKDEYLKAETDLVKELLDRIKALEELEREDELPEKVKQDNIVVVEVGEKFGVVGMDDVWPMASRQDWDPGYLDEQQRRVFDGDRALASKLLSMAVEPLGQVVLTFFEQIPQFMQRGQPVVAGQIPSIWLRTLRERLEKANLKVTEWNLAQSAGPPEPEDGRKQVLLVLPPPEPAPYPPMRDRGPPQWGEQQADKIRKAIEGGANAIFLARYLRPTRWAMTGSPPYGLADYLQDDWGLEVKTDLRVVQAVPDELNPGTCKLPVVRWWYMPLSTFTNHPVGRPLRARRMYWADACPVRKAEKTEVNVTVEDILVVPKTLGSSWAAANVQQLERQMWEGRSDGVVPGSAAGDLMPPLALAVEARKAIADRSARIIVLGVGYSFIDQFLTPRVPRFEADETLESDPPPIGNVDLVINSAYHLLDQGKFIGAGPAVVQPIRIVSPGTLATVKILFGLIWPLLVLLAGGVVMIFRKR